MSKGLEALYSGIEVNTKEYGNCIAYTQDCIDIIEKELKALEIIKKKRVDVFELLLGISNSVYRNPLERYNSYVEGSFNAELTPQEYELLKEEFEDE